MINVFCVKHVLFAEGKCTYSNCNSFILMQYANQINNLINIPRNLNGSGVTTDPSNLLFPNELCDPFRYLQLSNLKTYLVIRSPIIFETPSPLGQDLVSTHLCASLLMPLCFGLVHGRPHREAIT